MCFNISSERVFQVAEQKPAIIIVYDYYEPARRVSCTFCFVAEMQHDSFYFQVEFNYLISKKTTLEEVCGANCWVDSSEAAASTNAGISSWGVRSWLKYMSYIIVVALYNRWA